MRTLPGLAPLVLLAFGCNKVVGDAHATEPSHSAPKHEAKPAPAGAAKESDAHAHASDAVRYAVPFAWEVSKDEPLAKTRAYLGELLGDNALHARRGPAYFAPLAKGQSPRATVVACSDSRVQADAWDSTPENDDFTIRNIGNQVKNALGSVEYGLEHLHTPVLFILGHTGCGAVKAAMGNRDGLSAPIRAELEALKLPAATKGIDEKKAWAQAVVANVNLQVAFAVSEFGELLGEGKVTVVGAVYDLTNDLGRGPGVISIVNVNGNTEAERLKAFETALRGARPPGDADSPAELDAMANLQALAGRSAASVAEAAPARVPAEVVPAAPAHAGEHGHEH